jgi:hypothetical protein
MINFVGKLNKEWQPKWERMRLDSKHASVAMEESELKSLPHQQST